MFNINRATFLGRLAEDPVVRKTQAGKSVASFRLATNRSVFQGENKERKEVADFHNMVAWGKLASLSEKYLKKGNPVYLEGRLQTRSWDDESKGKQYRTEVVVENIIFLGSGNATAVTEEDIVTEDIPFTE